MKFIKIQAACGRVFALDSRGRLWHYRGKWEQIEGPERDGETLAIVDFAVAYDPSNDIGSGHDIYVLAIEERLVGTTANPTIYAEGVYPDRWVALS